MESTRTLVADIRRNSLDDGPGVRTSVFFKGCVLSCVWCHNPETIRSQAEVQHASAECLGCRGCERACPRGAISFPSGGRRHDVARCATCGACAEACPSGALRVVGTSLGVEELCDKLLRDEPFFRNTGGGVTLTGGEPTLHIAYVTQLAERLHSRGVHVLLETCGLFDGASFDAMLLRWVDMIYFDIKLADAEEHRRYTGRDNAVIVDNLTRLARIAPERLLARVPLVPGITDTERNLAGIGRLLRGAGLQRVALLPYNPLWLAKSRSVGREPVYRHERFMSDEELQRCRGAMTRAGVAVL